MTTNEDTGGVEMSGEEDRSAMEIIAEFLVREAGEKFKTVMRAELPMLRKIAEDLSGKEDESGAVHWSYVDCEECGGVKSFLDWLEKKVRA